MELLIKDIRYSMRSLLKQPGFSTIAVITLALGMGANTAIFSLVHAVLLRPLPFPESNRLVVVKDQNGKTGETFPAVSPADFFDWRNQSQSFANAAAYSGWPVTLLEGERSEMIPATRVTDEFFGADDYRHLRRHFILSGPADSRDGNQDRFGSNAPRCADTRDETGNDARMSIHWWRCGTSERISDFGLRISDFVLGGVQPIWVA